MDTGLVFVLSEMLSHLILGVRCETINLKTNIYSSTHRNDFCFYSVLVVEYRISLFASITENSEPYLFIYLFIFVFLPFLGPLPWHMEVPRLGV